jgi:hypothetical protein
MDGGHFERSPMYHALLLHGLLDLANVLREEDEQRVRIVERLPGLLHFLAALTHPDGEIALFNDAAFEIAPPPGALLAYAERLGLRTPPAGPASFPKTGYHAWRRGSDALFVDAGLIGPDYLSTHAHGDVFSYELSLDGRRVVVDGGTSTYEAGAERDWVRSTRAHNTVEVAGVDQCEFFGAFRVGRRGRPRDVAARVSEDGLSSQAGTTATSAERKPRHHRELVMASGALRVGRGGVRRPQRPSRASASRRARGGLVGQAPPHRGGRRRPVAPGLQGTLSIGPAYARFGVREPCLVVACGRAASELGYARAPVARGSHRPAARRWADGRSRAGRLGLLGNRA